MAGEANIWNPRTLIELSADTKAVEEKITATAAQTIFTLTSFLYAVGTGSLWVYKNGVLLNKGSDWVEQTTSTFALTTTQVAGDKITALGHVAITADVDVRDTDIYVTNYQAIRDYAGTEITLYSQGKTTAGDTGESFFHKKTGAAPGFYVDDAKTILVPSGGDGSIGWLRANTTAATTHIDKTNVQDLDDYLETQNLSTVAAMVALTLPAKTSVKTFAYYDGWAATLHPEGGALYTIATLAEVRAIRGGGWVPDEQIDHTVAGGNVAILDVGDHLNAKQAGIIADGATDQYAKIEKALAYVRSNKGKLYFPANRAGIAGFTEYSYGTTLEHKASDVVIEGESQAVRLLYTGAGTGMAVNINRSTAPSTILQRERWGLKNITLKSSTGAIALDFTGGSYGRCENLEVNYTAANAEMLWAIGDSGFGPYFNDFSGISLIGGAGRTQDGIVLKPDGLGNLADGPNANNFVNIKRIASVRRAINIVSGQGNMFTNIGAESVSDAMIVLNNVASFADSGTSTSVTNNTLVDTSKTWSTVAGDPLNFTNDTVSLTSGLPGETRRITSNTVDTLTLDRPWSQNPGATVTYTISEGRAINNMFTNVRHEGLATDNPDSIRIEPGARNNELIHLESGSLGTGLTVKDNSHDQSNKIRQGDLIIETFQVLNPGASATVEVTPPRASTEGGIRSGSQMCLEYVEMISPNFVTGSATATLTVDHGGSAVGNGDETLILIVDDVTQDGAYKAGGKLLRSTINKGIFASLTTNANVNAASDFYVKIAYRVQ